MAAELDAEHAPRCSCLTCQARRWMRYTDAKNAYPEGVGLKITSYGGVGGGTGEPDRLLADPVCTEADFRRALALVPTRFLALVVTEFRSVPEPWHSTASNPHRSRTVAVMDAIASRAFDDWNRARLEGMREAQETPAATLYRLLDECAVEMGRVMGERREGRPSRLRKTVEVAEGPPEWADAPARRR